MKSVLTVIGTRPEAIKLAPILQSLNNHSKLKSQVCVTGQHSDLLDPFLKKFSIQADFRFGHGSHASSLQQNMAHILNQFGEVFSQIKPNLVIVQGDTTSAFAAALAAFYACVPIAHVEAGLRTGHMYSPWPEEAHRCLITRLATYFFAPTPMAKESLMLEGVAPEKIWVVGNTAIDAIRLLTFTRNASTNLTDKCVVVTVHRRENHGEPLKQICLALQCIAKQFPQVTIHFVIHPNPAVKNIVCEMLNDVSNINLTPSLEHDAFIALLVRATFILTDSGGIQEEAPFLGKPLLILRDTTERLEGVHAGTARLIGTKTTAIIHACQELLENEELLKQMSRVHYPYGDGFAADRIIQILETNIFNEVA